MRPQSFSQQSPSRALAALFFFLLVNSCFESFVPPFDAFETSFQRWTWFDLKGYRDLPKAPDVVFIGSSLVQRLVNQGDAIYLNKPVSLLEHHRSQYFEDLSGARLRKPLSSYTFDLAGLHASDAYSLINCAFTDKRPATLVYCIAPRDLHDNALVNAAGTETYALTSALADQSQIKNEIYPTLPERFESKLVSGLSNISEFFHRRTSLNVMTYRAIRSIMVDKQLIGFIGGGVDITKILPLGELVGDFQGKAMCLPEQALNAPQEDNLWCYEWCYKPFKKTQYENQLSCLRKIIALAKARNINVMLINMPLRHDNLNAMTPNFYALYRSNISEIAHQNNIQLVDMFDPHYFVDSDFVDSVHLSGLGAVKFVKHLTDKLSTPTLAAMRIPSDRSQGTALARSKTTVGL